uniref:Uncharacterized protein n=1 Tax=Denticeps clupeoides TaxID=299321 RepID=A0AAY4AX60_9TELE
KKTTTMYKDVVLLGCIETGKPQLISISYLGEMNRECWDAASLTVIRSRKLRLGESVDELWDFMTYLRTQPQETHHELFMELAQFFWERYVDCVLARAHGLGKLVVSSSTRKTHRKLCSCTLQFRKLRWVPSR